MENNVLKQTDFTTLKNSLIEWYRADRNKPFIYYIVLAAWTCLFVIILTVLPLTANSTTRASFYIPLIIFIPLIFFMTHWLLLCSNDMYCIFYENSIRNTNMNNGDNGGGRSSHHDDITDS
jgi:hypothetical protein